MKKIIFFCGILLLLGSCSLNTKPKNIQQPAHQLKNEVPILLVHGSGGDEDSFDYFTDTIMEEHNSSNEVLKVIIDADGTLHYQGTLSKEAKRPFISIGFTENDNPIEEWSDGIKKLLIDLKKDYQFEQIDAVGYSNGGLALTYYAETIQEETDVPSLKNIVILAAPFNDLDSEENTPPIEFTDELEKYLDLQQNLASDLNVLSIAGDDGTNEQTDGIVPLQSALASRLIFQNYVHSYIEKQALGEDASHLNLVNNNQIIDWVFDFLYTDNWETTQKIQLLSN